MKNITKRSLMFMTSMLDEKDLTDEEKKSYWWCKNWKSETYRAWTYRGGVMKLLWNEKTFEIYMELSVKDKTYFKKLNKIIKELIRNGKDTQISYAKQYNSVNMFNQIKSIL